MVNVTERAKQELGSILASANADAPHGLRLVRNPIGKFDLLVSQEQEGDQVVEHEGSKVLLVEHGLAQALEGLTIDCQENAGVPRLIIK
jgi:Fe-S cluster assembly iron-binding protein IscA